MKRSFMLVFTVLTGVGQALALLGACASDVSNGAPQPGASEVATTDGQVSEPDSGLDVEAGPCVDCEYFPETCSPDVLCLDGPFDPSRVQGDAETFDLRTQINVIVGRGTNDVWAAGTVGALAHFDGSSWTKSGPDTQESLRGLRLFDDGELAFGSQMHRVFLHGLDLPDAGTSPDGGWTTVEEIPTPSSYTMFGRLYAFTSAWAAPGAQWTWCTLSSPHNGSSPRRPTGLWRMRRVPDAAFEIKPALATCAYPCSSERMASVHGVSPDVLWAVGSQGAAFLIEGADGDTPHLEALNSLTWNQLNGVWAASESEAWAVGAGGTIRHYTKDSLSAEIVPDVPPNANLRAVWGTSPSDIWAVGEGSIVLHYDGKSWSRVKIAGLGGRRPDLTTVWTPSPNHVWIGGQGVILSLGGRP